MLRITRERLMCVDVAVIHLEWKRRICTGFLDSRSCHYIHTFITWNITRFYTAGPKTFDIRENTKVLPLKSCFCVVISQNWAALTWEEFVLHWKWLKQTQSGRWNTLLWCFSKQWENQKWIFDVLWDKKKKQQMGAKFWELPTSGWNNCVCFPRTV